MPPCATSSHIVPSSDLEEVVYAIRMVLQEDIINRVESFHNLYFAYVEYNSEFKNAISHLYGNQNNILTIRSAIYFQSNYFGEGVLLRGENIQQSGEGEGSLCIYTKSI